MVAQSEDFAIVDAPITCTQLDPPHRHDTYEIGCILRGTGVIVMGQRVYPYVPGQVYIINDLEPHGCYSDDGGSRLLIVYFHPSLLESRWIGQTCCEIGKHLAIRKSAWNLYKIFTRYRPSQDRKSAWNSYQDTRSNRLSCVTGISLPDENS